MWAGDAGPPVEVLEELLGESDHVAGGEPLTHRAAGLFGRNAVALEHRGDLRIGVEALQDHDVGNGGDDAGRSPGAHREPLLSQASGDHVGAHAHLGADFFHGESASDVEVLEHLPGDPRPLDVDASAPVPPWRDAVAVPGQAHPARV